MAGNRGRRVSGNRNAAPPLTIIAIGGYPIDGKGAYILTKGVGRNAPAQAAEDAIWSSSEIAGCARNDNAQGKHSLPNVQTSGGSGTLPPQRARRPRYIAFRPFYFRPPRVI